MEEWIRKLSAVWQKQPGASPQTIQKIEQSLNVTFPSDYRQFLLWSDGGEGWNDDTYLSLWSSNELLSLNNDYMIGHYLPGIVCIGTDGGGVGYGLAFDQANRIPFVGFSLGNLDPATTMEISASFNVGILQLLELT